MSKCNTKNVHKYLSQRYVKVMHIVGTYPYVVQMCINISTQTHSCLTSRTRAYRKFTALHILSRNRISSCSSRNVYFQQSSFHPFNIFIPILIQPDSVYQKMAPTFRQPAVCKQLSNDILYIQRNSRCQLSKTMRYLTRKTSFAFARALKIRRCYSLS